MCSVELLKEAEEKRNKREKDKTVSPNHQRSGLARSSSLLYSLLMSVTYLILIFVPHTLGFRVNRIRIDDVSFISDFVREDIVSNFHYDADVYSAVKAIHRICESNAWASKCKVSFSLPDTINVEFDKIIPVALLVDDSGKVYFVSNTGEKIETHITLSLIYKFRSKLNLPFIKLQSQRCSIPDIVRFISYVERELPRFIDQFICSDFSVELYSTDKYKVMLPIDDLYGAFSRFLRMRSHITDAVEVDARGREKIFVK